MLAPVRKQVHVAAPQAFSGAHSAYTSPVSRRVCAATLAAAWSLRRKRTMAWSCHGSTNAEMVRKLKAAGIINHRAVEEAMMAVDRGFFSLDRTCAYEDRPQGIGYGVTISAPHMHAHCLELLANHMKPGAKVLDVGSGSGYLTACMAHMACVNDHNNTSKCVGIEHVKELVQASRKSCAHLPWAAQLMEQGTLVFVSGDGRQGCPGHGPFDAIHVGAASPEVPGALIEQLVVGGRLIVPVGPEGGSQELMVVDKHEHGYESRPAMGVIYVPLTNLDHQLSRT